MNVSGPGHLLSPDSPFRQLAERAPVMLWATAADGSAVLLNVGWRTFRGLAESGPVPDGWAFGIHQADRQAVLEQFRTAHAQQEPYGAEYRVRRGDGEFRWVHDHGTPWFDADGRFMGEMGCCVDITDQGPQHWTAANAERRLKHLIETSKDLVYRVRLSEPPVIEYMGGAVQAITGLTREEIYADAGSIRRAVHPDDLPLLAWTPADAARAPMTSTYRWVHSDGRIVWAEHYRMPVFDAAGQVVALEGIARDVTQRVESERKLRESEDQLRQLAARLQGAREEERAEVSRELHDQVGQTLTALKLEINRAVAAFASQPGSVTQVDRLQSVVGLVDLSIAAVKRISARLRPATLDHLGLAEAIRWEARTFTVRTGIRCQVRANRQTTRLDAEQQTALFRIAQEALNNVVCHANASSVQIALKETAASVELRIRDNGRGITPEQAAAPGSIGLLGMKERAALVGGAFTVAGERGHGTVVTVRVPLAQSNDRRSRSRSESQVG